VAGFNTTLANGSLGGLFSAAFASGFAGMVLENAVILGGLSSNSTQLAEITANAFSQAVLALAIGVISNRTNLLEQSRTSLSLTRVPKVPLYILLVLKFLYVLGVVLLAVVAICFTHPSETQEVKARLSIKGLAAAYFEPDAQKNQAVSSLEEMFSEHNPKSEKETKVGIVKTEQGGWKYVTVGMGALEGVSELVKAVAKGT
jgi:hypothetical protein